MLTGFFKLLARLPLSLFHGVGVTVGWLMYWGSRTYAAHTRKNLHASGVCSSASEYRAVLDETVRETGKTVLEWMKVWFMPPADVAAFVECGDWKLVEEARLQGKGIIFILPHLGSFQMVMRYMAQRLPLTALYRTPRQKWREPVLMAGSGYAGLSMAPTTLNGVQKLYRALARGEAVALPPDQAPNSRGGVWAIFFGQPAYTMTLPRKLQRATGAALIAAYAERLSDGRGFRLELEAVPTKNFDEVALNRIVENLVRRCPGQYLWGYNRYKVPRKSMVEPSVAAGKTRRPASSCRS